MFKKQLILILLVFNITCSLSGQNNKHKPKLVVGIVIDQMRYEYLHRFADQYSDTGFKRLMDSGFMLRNGHFNYIPTKTAPGHASIYSGTTPAIHGIIGNDWYDRSPKSNVYCVSDNSQKTVGSATSRGQMSPRRMLTTTIGDELKLSNQMQSKVISMSVKDRGAVLPGGHTANAAYWFDPVSGNMITSSFYMSELPQWVSSFNQKKYPDKYLNSTWETLLPINQYTMSRKDNYSLEGKLLNEKNPTFPHQLKKLKKDKKEKYGVINYTPFMNTMITDLAIEALKNESMGKGKYTDMLAISYSSTDYIGHKFGPHSVELHDTYLRLDREISRLLSTLDKSVGKGNYTLFLTADHAVAAMPDYLQEKKIPAGNFNSKQLAENLTKHLSSLYGEGMYVEKCINLQLYFDWKEVNAKKVNTQELFQHSYQFLMSQAGIMQVYSANSLLNGDFGEKGIKGDLIRGFNHRRSGEIMLVLKPGWFDNQWKIAADHGSGYAYDSHVPILFYGAGIPKGSTVKYHTITDIAPTICTLLDIKLPNGSTGQPIDEIFE